MYLKHFKPLRKQKDTDSNFAGMTQTRKSLNRIIMIYRYSKNQKCNNIYELLQCVKKHFYETVYIAGYSNFFNNRQDDVVLQESVQETENT